MAFKRKSGSMYGPKRKYARRSAPPVAKKALSAAVRKAVYGLAEKKRTAYHIDEEPLGSIAQGSNSWNLCVPANGNNVITRVGQEISLTGMSFKGILHNNGNVNNVVRVLIGYWKDTVAFSSASQIFDSLTGFGPATTFGTINNLNSLYWATNKTKFQTLLDRTYVLGTTSSVDASNVKLLDYKLKLGQKIKFEGSDSGTDGQDKNLIMIAWTGEAGDDATLGTNVEISGLSYVYYTDL